LWVHGRERGGRTEQRRCFEREVPVGQQKGAAGFLPKRFFEKTRRKRRGTPWRMPTKCKFSRTSERIGEKKNKEKVLQELVANKKKKGEQESTERLKRTWQKKSASHSTAREKTGQSPRNDLRMRKKLQFERQPRQNEGGKCPLEGTKKPGFP